MSNTRRPTSSSSATVLQQKSSMITLLQSELTGLNDLPEMYNAKREAYKRLSEKFELLSTEIDALRRSQSSQQDEGAKQLVEQKGVLSATTADWREKTAQLKELRENKMRQSQEKLASLEDQINKLRLDLAEMHSSKDHAQLEQHRLQANVANFREEINKLKRNAASIRRSVDGTTDKCTNVNNYLNTLQKEASNMNGQLNLLEEENAEIKNNIAQLTAKIENDLEKEIQRASKSIRQLTYEESMKELELKRRQTEIKEQLRQYRIENEKYAAMFNHTEDRQREVNKLNGLIIENSSEINNIIEKNDEIKVINSQLRDDLVVCQRHLENVLRVNKQLETEINNWKETNSIVIRKMAGEDVSNFKPNATVSKWGHSSRITNAEGAQGKM